MNLGVRVTNRRGGLIDAKEKRDEGGRREAVRSSQGAVVREQNRVVRGQ